MARNEQPSLFVVPPATAKPEYVAPIRPPPTPAPEPVRLAIVPAVPAEDVSIEPMGDGRFVVAIVRHYGGSVAAVIYTRAQLEMFLRRIPAALEVGG